MAHAAAIRSPLMFAALALAAALAPAAGVATAWQAVTAQSSLTFRATQAGAEFEGRFSRFTAAISFDPKSVPGCVFDVRIATASADTQESQRDDLLKGPDWFDVAQHPEARFAASKCRASGKGYVADGQLTLRGTTRPVRVQFTFTPGTAGRARLDGAATLRRLDFGVGRGEWQSTEWVGDPVRIAFALRLQR